MSGSTPLSTALDDAIALRRADRDLEARQALLDLHSEHPDDPQVNLQTAWIHDKLGLEAEAVPYYEAAIAAGLEGEDLHDALLGLGSTYRALGEYERAVAVLEDAVATMPGQPDLEVFWAMALYNVGRHKEACATLLRLLVDTTSDDAIRRYEGAVRTYLEDLDRTWR